MTALSRMIVARPGFQGRVRALEVQRALRTAAAICLLLAATVAPAYAQAPAQPALPPLTAPVNDFAKVIDSSAAAELDRLIRTLQSATGDVVVVATIDTFAPYATIDEYAVRLFEKAGIGQRKTDSGLLILLAVKDRRVRIEVGYGIEEFITDGFAGETIRNQMLPAFREGSYGRGLVAGTTRVVMRIAEGRGVTLDNVALPAQRARERNSGPGIWTILVIIIFLALMSKFRGMGGGVMPHGRRGRSTWSGWHGGLGGFGGGFGGGGGGFGGFGGGRSGGGGASGGW